MTLPDSRKTLLVAVFLVSGCGRTESGPAFVAKTDTVTVVLKSGNRLMFTGTRKQVVRDDALGWPTIQITEIPATTTRTNPEVVQVYVAPDALRWELVFQAPFSSIDYVVRR